MRSSSGSMYTEGCSSVYSSQSRSFFLSLRHGRSMSIPRPLTTLRRFAPCQAPGQAAIAPSRMLSEGSGTSRSSATSCTTPSPWHSGHAPATVLGENDSASSRAAPGG